MTAELPAGWRRTKLGELGEWTSGGTPSRTEPSYYGPGMPWVKTGNLPDGPVLDIPESITELGLKNSSAKCLPKGTLLVAMYGATIGRLGLLESEAATNQACAALLPHGQTAQFIPYIFQYLLGQREELRRIGQGGAQPNISQAILKDFEIPLPPVGEQRRIVAKLEALQTRSRRARGALDAVPPLLEKLRQSILAAAFRGDLTKDWRAKQKDIEPATELLKRIRTERRARWEATKLAKMRKKGKQPPDDKWKAKYTEPGAVDATGLPNLPTGWCWAAVEDLAFVTKLAGFEYTKFVKYDPGGDLPVIKAENVSKRGFTQTEFSRIRSETVEQLTRSVLHPGDVLMVFVGAGLGQVARVPTGNRYFLGPNVAMVRCHPEVVVPAFVELFLRSPVGFSFSRGQSKSTAQGSISMEQIRRIPVAFPPLEEQLAVLEKAAALLAVVDRLGTAQLETARESARLETAVLSKAFRGELVPQDPNDEPAEAMLARARSSNGSAPANGSTPKRGRSRAAQGTEQPNE